MNILEIIRKKKTGKALSREEIYFFIDNFQNGNLPDYQVSALLMAINLKGMSYEETYTLTEAMLKTGEELNLREIFPHTVDKHSTGGVADTTTLIIAPILAAAGLYLGKMSGRGLGHTGGTIDKLESFPGFRVELEPEEFLSQIKDIRLALIAQTENLAPIDKKLYALRDVTATIDSIPLISSSIMSKKLAGGSQTILLDVKYGRGAFMKSAEEARELAQTMVTIGESGGRNMLAIISDMSSPLGMAIGNIIEVQEAIDVLKGQFVPRLSVLCREIVALLLMEEFKYTRNQAEEVYDEMISSGKALETLKKTVIAQGGDAAVIDNPNLWPKARHTAAVLAPRDGFIADWDALALGETAMNLGAGRKRKGDTIDLTAGIKLFHHVGSRITANEPVAQLYSSRAITDEDIRAVENALNIADEVKSDQLIAGIISRHNN